MNLHDPDMPPAPVATGKIDLSEARRQILALDQLLEDEFQALRIQAFDQFEALQAAKLDLLQGLSDLSERIKHEPEPPAEWLPMLELLRDCQRTWRRNEQLVVRQLEVVRGALRSMQAADPSASVELYDRLGQTSRRMGSRVFSDA